MFKHWYEKLTFSIAILCLFLFIAFDSWTMFIFEVLFLSLWVSSYGLPIKEGRRR